MGKTTLTNGRLKGGRKPIYKPIYIGIANYMERHNLTYQRFADKTGISKNTIHRIMIGQIDPCKKTIDRILEVTKLTYEEAFKEE